MTKNTKGLASHTQSNQPKIKQAKDTIHKILENRTGPDSSISSSMLANRVPVNASTVRDIIPQLRVERDMPIVSGPTGYYLVDSTGELERQLERMSDRIETIECRREELTRAYNRSKHE